MKKIAFLIIIFLYFTGISHLKAQIAPLSMSMPPLNSEYSHSEELGISFPLHEVRAVWIATIGGIDWPHTFSQSQSSMKKQQKEFCDILDKLNEAGINTILLQTRIRATTIFPSKLSAPALLACSSSSARLQGKNSKPKNEPWDGCLSGFPGESPGYDALEFCINECHKRGMKLHAWIVTLPVGRWDGAGCINLRKTFPELLKRIGDQVYMNPEKEGTAIYLADFCKDLVRRYDVDGIHLDYCRYPDGWNIIKDKDKARENITRIVRAVSSAVRSEKPWVQMSCSPVGKYADTKRQWSHGWNARDVVCQDAIKWLQDGDMDALYPMMYFRDENFYPFALDWQERSCVQETRNGKRETFNKIIAPGLGIYFMHPKQKNWALEDCTRELWVLRQYGMGNCMFRSKFFTDNTKGIYDFYNDWYGAIPALQTPMTWLSSEKPSAPTNLKAKQNKDSEVTLSWDSVAVCNYNLYGSDSYPVDITKAENILASNLTQNFIRIGKTGHIRYFAVTATDRYGKESDALQLPNPDKQILSPEMWQARLHEAIMKP